MDVITGGYFIVGRWEWTEHTAALKQEVYDLYVLDEAGELVLLHAGYLRKGYARRRIEREKGRYGQARG